MHKKIIGKIQYMVSEPNNNGIVINNPPQEFLEKVRKAAIPIEIINTKEVAFLNKLLVLS